MLIMTIDEMNKVMTIFYSKQDGRIVASATGKQDIEFFGKEANDFSIIYDYVVVEKDEYILDNADKFKIEEGQIVLRPEEMNVLNKYIR